THVESLLIMAGASLLVIEAAYLFSASPLLYFRNIAFVNANHFKGYSFYLFDELKQGGWWYYFLVAFALKATVPTLLLIICAAVQATRGFLNRRGELILLASIAAYLSVISAAADQVGLRYILPLLPLVVTWAGHIVPTLLT